MPQLAEDEERRLGILAAAGDDVAAKQLIEANQRLVVTIARRHRALDPSLMNIIQEGNLGLVEALRRFDPSKGQPFSKFAAWFIREAIRMAYQPPPDLEG